MNLFTADDISDGMAHTTLDDRYTTDYQTLLGSQRGSRCY
jgi:hypothetical protein